MLLAYIDYCLKSLYEELLILARNDAIFYCF